MTVAPQPGPHNPARSTSPRVPGSVRRTTSTDITFPDGIGTSKLTLAMIEKHLATRATMRNWNTIVKLATKAGA